MKKKQRNSTKKIQKNELGFDDFLKQLQMMKKMGGMKDLMGMIPGMGKVAQNVDINDDTFKHIEAMIQSMTPEEKKKTEHHHHAEKTKNSQRKRKKSRRSNRSDEAV